MVKTTEPLVSIIVPVYNVEKYIDKCLSSILNQSYINIEIIIIDDASTDESSNKCDFWSDKDKRIKLIHHKVNKGLFATRMKGFENMKGDYFTTVDGDDFIEQGFIKSFMDVAIKGNCDIVISNRFKNIKNNKNNGDIITTPKLHSLERGIEGYITNIFDKTWGWTVWNKLYKKEVYLDSKKYLCSIDNYINTAEDLIFTSIFACQTKNISYVTKHTGYCYRYNPESITRQFSIESLINRVQSLVFALYEFKKFISLIDIEKKYSKQIDSFIKNQLSDFIWTMHSNYENRLSSTRLDLEARIIDMQNIIVQYQKRLEELNSSRTFKTGKAVLFPYRIFKKIITKILM